MWKCLSILRLEQKTPQEEKDLSASLLYHGFGLIGYRYVGQSFMFFQGVRELFQHADP